MKLRRLRTRSTDKPVRRIVANLDPATTPADPLAIAHEVTAPCSRCGGTGRTPVTLTDARTLAAIGYDWTATSMIFARVRALEPGALQRNSLCMRLARLLQEGLLDRRPSQTNVKEYDYRRI